MKKITVLIALFTVTTAFAQPKTNYNFQYKAEGTKSILPVQVFDDGKQTIFQFRQNQRIPAIFYESAGEWVFVEPVNKGAFFICHQSQHNTN
ncbi:TrbG/VirB9 family P-type conjugative transfer protein (plasmid) [Comamonas aquatica]|nr:TrbG/VirB9 family P-type conjugative transfer protein [Comamonas aquatica]